MLTADRVIVVPGGLPGRGEVWAFCDAEGRLLVHRCRQGGDQPVFQGDGNRLPDTPVPTSWLVGRVTWIETEGGVRRLGAGDRVRGLSWQAWQRVRAGLAARAPSLPRARRGRG